MKSFYFVPVFLACAAIPAKAQNDAPSLQWTKSINGISNVSHTVIKSVKDNTGNTYVMAGDNFDMIIAKYDNSGAVIKTFKYNNYKNGSDEGHDLAVDHVGNVYMAGRSFVNYIWSPSIVKYNAAGVQLEEHIINSTFYTNSVIKTIQCDASGGVFFGGAKNDSLFIGYMKNTGEIAWEKTYRPATYGTGEVFDLDLDAAGFAYFTGQVKNAAGDYDAISFRVSNTGSIFWTRYLAGTAGGDDRGKRILVDISSNAFVLAETADLAAGNHSLTLAKYNASGGFQWMNPQTYAGQTDAQAVDMRLDLPGNAYIVGNVYTSSVSCFGYMFKINPTSDFDFNQVFDYPMSSVDEITSVELDNTANYYVAVSSSNGNYESRVIKNNTAGGITWTYVYNTSDDNERSATIHVDNSNNTYMSTHHGVGNTNVSLIRVDQTGNLDWDGVFDEYGNPGDGALKVFTNGNNSVYTLGNIRNSFSQNDVVVTKHDTYGNLLWQYVENSVYEDEAKDFVHDADFNISFLYNSGVTSHIRKLDSIGSPFSHVTLSRFYDRMMLVGSDFYLAGSSGISNNNEFTVSKIDVSLVSAPAYTYNPPTVAGAKTYLNSMEVDGTNRIYAYGELRQDETLPTYKKKLLIQKMNTAGGLVWKKTISNLDSTSTNPFTTMAKKVLVDGSNNVYLLGHSSNAGYIHSFSFLIKLDNSGNVVWRKEFNNLDNNHESAADMIMSAGATITTLTHGTQGLIVRKIDRATGNVIWESVFDEIPGDYNGYVLDQNALGDIYAVGTKFTLSDFRDYVLVKYDAAGNRQWYTTYTGSQNGNDYPRDMKVTANGRIYIAGDLVMQSGENTDFGLIKLCDFAQPQVVSPDVLTNICAGNNVMLACPNVGIDLTGGYFNWSPTGETNDTISVNNAGDYFCTITKLDGCTKSTNPVTVSLKAAPATPAICMVTVDSASTHNIVLWDKTSTTGATGFNIYREDVTSVYTLIGSVDYDDNSIYHDYDANPNVTTKRYKISAVDSCGNESELSQYHNTIYIVYSGLGQFLWNPLYTIESSANPVDNYVLMRDDNGTGVWNQVAITAGTQNTIIDADYATYPDAIYRVETLWSIGCDSVSRAGVSTSRSNIRVPALTILNVEEKNMAGQVQVYPNPAAGIVNIQAIHNIDHVVLYDAAGKHVMEKNGNGHTLQLDTDRLERGLYQVKINSNGSTMVKRLVKQ